MHLLQSQKRKQRSLPKEQHHICDMIRLNKLKRRHKGNELMAHNAIQINLRFVLNSLKI